MYSIRNWRFIKVKENEILINIPDFDLSKVIHNPKYLYNNKPVPRVTEILSDMLHEDYLMEWANNVGLYQHKSHIEYRDEATAIGTYVHESIERYIKYNEYPDSNVIERDFEFYRYDITTNELSEKDISDAVEKISPKVHDLLLEFDQDVYENLAKVYTFPSNYEYSHYGNVDNEYIWFLRDDEDGQYLYYGYDFENKFDNYYNQES